MSGQQIRTSYDLGGEGQIGTSKVYEGQVLHAGFARFPIQRGGQNAPLPPIRFNEGMLITLVGCN